MKKIGFLLLAILFVLLLYYMFIEDSYVSDESFIAEICAYLFIGLFLIIPLYNIIFYKLTNKKISLEGKSFLSLGVGLNIFTYIMLLLFVGLPFVGVIPENAFILFELVVIGFLLVLPFTNLFFYWKLNKLVV